MGRQVSIIIYGYNEAENALRTVEETLAFLREAGIDGEVVFVDDGSRDRTPELLARFASNPAVVSLRHEVNRGIGAAIRTGLGGAGGEWVAPIPADGQIPPAEVKKLLDAVGAGDLDLVCSYFPGRFETADDSLRRVFSVGFHALCVLCLGGGWGMDGVWMARRADAKRLRFVSDTFVANIEIPVRLIRAGSRWRRVPLEVRPRRQGSSKIFSAGRIAGVGLELVRTGWKMRLTE